jgi:hypothetical protein
MLVHYLKGDMYAGFFARNFFRRGEEKLWFNPSNTIIKLRKLVCLIVTTEELKQNF